MINDSSFNPAQLAQLARQTLEDLDDSSFRIVRRGYEPRVVKALLRDASQQIHRLLAAVEQLSDRVAEFEAIPHEELEAKRIRAALGDEAVRILDVAQTAADAQVERAETERMQIVEQARAEAMATVQEARAKGRESVSEARQVRERILSDLARKRHTHRVEAEKFRAVRDHLLESLVSHQRRMDEVLKGLIDAVPKAATAAERAGLRMASEPEVTVSQLEAQIEASRYAGLPLTISPEAGDRAPFDHAEFDHEETAGAEVTDDHKTTSTTSHGSDELATGTRTASEADARDGVPSEVVASDADTDDAGDTATSNNDDNDDAGKVDTAADTAESIFARLRSAGKSRSSAPDASASASAETASASAQPATASAQPESRSNRLDPIVATRDADRTSDGAGEDDLTSAAQDVAVNSLTRELKRLIMDEQSKLLDAMRRIGRRAVSAQFQEENTAYVKALRSPLQHFVSDIGVSIDDLDFKSASTAIETNLIIPVRSRLKALADEISDIEELIAKVRAVYRESRSYRAQTAAEAAFEAAWAAPATNS